MTIPNQPAIKLAAFATKSPATGKPVPAENSNGSSSQGQDKFQMKLDYGQTESLLNGQFSRAKGLFKAEELLNDQQARTNSGTSTSMVELKKRRRIGTMIQAVPASLATGAVGTLLAAGAAMSLAPALVAGAVFASVGAIGVACKESIGTGLDLADAEWTMSKGFLPQGEPNRGVSTGPLPKGGSPIDPSRELILGVADKALSKARDSQDSAKIEDQEKRREVLDSITGGSLQEMYLSTEGFGQRKERKVLENFLIAEGRTVRAESLGLTELPSTPKAEGAMPLERLGPALDETIARVQENRNNVTVLDKDTAILEFDGQPHKFKRIFGAPYNHKAGWVLTPLYESHGEEGSMVELKSLYKSVDRWVDMGEVGQFTSKADGKGSTVEGPYMQHARSPHRIAIDKSLADPARKFTKLEALVFHETEAKPAVPWY